MKTLYTTLVTALFGMNASAQVVFDLSGAIPPNGVIEREWWYADPITVTTSGVNVIWDFSASLTLTACSMNIVVTDPAATPFAVTFPEATHAYGEVAPWDTIWYYFKLVTDSLFQLALRSYWDCFLVQSGPMDDAALAKLLSSSVHPSVAAVMTNW